jgi:hypothetical protein
MLGTPDCDAEPDLTAPGGAVSKRQISEKNRSNASRERKSFFSVTDQSPGAARATAAAPHNASYACAATITGITRDQRVAMQNPNREINANMS